MTPRATLLIALIGLGIAASCGLPLYFIGDLDPANDDALLAIILLDLGALLGLTILVVGLAMAAATTLRKKKRRQPSYDQAMRGTS